MRFLPVMLLVAGPALAQHDVRDRAAPWVTSVETTRAAGMGEAHAAVSTGNDALLVNPAGLAQTRRYHLQVDGVWDPSWPAQAITATLVDSISSPVGSGLVFSRWASGQPDGRGEGWLAGLGYSVPVGQSAFFGGTTKLLRFHTPDGLATKWAQDFGLLLRRGSLSWAAVVQNVAFEKIPLFPLTATAGVSWGSDSDLRLAFDYKADLSDTQNVKHRAAVGAETLFDQTLVLRAGGTFDPGDHRVWLSGGAALIIDKGELQGVFRKQVRGGDDQLFEVGFALFLE